MPDAALRGPVRRPRDPGYDDARANWHGVDSRPAVIVEAVDENDVCAAVRLAAREGLPIAVQNTGHGTFTGCDGGLLLRIGALGGVTIDERRKRVRVGAGVRLRAVLAAATRSGLVPLSGSSPWVGAAGFTLGGGIGWSTRLFGYASDSLAGVDVVTAAGDLLRVDRSREADLFWGMRGAGGSLGVVTALEIDLHPLPHLYGGVLAFACRDPYALLVRYRDWAATEPDELSTVVALRHFPAGQPRPWGPDAGLVAAFRVQYHGRPDEAERHLAPLRDLAADAVVDSWRRLDPRSLARTAPPPAASPTGGAQEFFRDLPDEVLAAVAEAVLAPRTPVTLAEVRHWGGAIRRRPVVDSPAGPRDIEFGVGIEARYPIADDPVLAGLVDTLRAHATRSAVRTLLTDPTRTWRAYAPANWDRLGAVKRAVDPDNLFRVGHTIPLTGWAAESRASVGVAG